MSTSVFIEHSFKSYVKVGISYLKFSEYFRQYKIRQIYAV